MQLLAVDELYPGMILAMDVVSENFVTIATEGTMVSEDTIKRLIKLNIEFIYVKNEVNVEIEPEFNKLDDPKALDHNFSKTINAIKDIFNDLKIGDTDINSKLFDTVDPLVKGILVNNNVLSNLRNMTYDDDYTLKHSVNVGLLSAMIGKWLNLTKSEINELSLAGILHDIGKSKIPRYILNKPKELSDQELAIAKNHAIYSFEILSEGNEFSEKIKKAVLSHHERFDGSGYPDGLKGKEIPIYSRIIAIADIFDAMTSDKVYKAKTSPFSAAEEIKLMSFDKLDPQIANLFLKKIAEFYVGNKVLLSTGEEGEIVYLNKFDIHKPLVKVNDKFIDLSTTLDIKIREVR